MQLEKEPENSIGFKMENSSWDKQEEKNNKASISSESQPELKERTVCRRTSSCRVMVNYRTRQAALLTPDLKHCLLDT